MKSWVICSAYFPGEERTCPPELLGDIVAYCEEKNLQLVIGCDANAHHTAWGSTNINIRGESLLQFILSQGLLTANIGNKPTFITAVRKEVLDITLCTSGVSDSIKNWHVSEEPSSSDHRHIRFDISIPHLIEEKFRNPRETNWEGFSDSLRRILEGGIAPVREVEGLEVAVEQVSEAITAAYQENCSEKIRKNRGKTVWWNKHLEDLRVQVRRLFNKAKSNNDWDAYKSKLTLYNKEIRKAKRDSWRRFCEEVMDGPAVSRIHRVLAKEGCTANEVGSIRRNDGTYTETPMESMQVLIEAYFPGSMTRSDPVDTQSPRQRLNRPSREDWKLATEVVRPDKVRWAINKFSPFKSPGMDGIYPVFLQKGQDVLIPYLCKIFGACLAWRFVPSIWQKVKVIYLPKVGKISDMTPKSYRPISLSSFLLKTLERLLDRYIRDELLRDAPFSDRQYAYQPGKSTDLALDDLNRLLTKSLEDKEIAVATFLDIEGAFNNATTNSLTNALSDRGVPAMLCQWIKASLEKRTISSSLGGATIEARVSTGCPQGGVLSPLLWATLVDTLLKKLSAEGFYCLGYADDLVIVVRGRFASTILESSQRALNMVNRWCSRENLSINPHKTTVTIFTRKRALEGLRPLELNGVEIPFAREAKYLGVIFDQKMTWNSHIQKVTQKATIALGRTRRMCGKNWGLKPRMTLWLYTKVVRPMVTYGSVVWWTKTMQAGAVGLLSGVQRLACLCVTGALRTAPTAAMEVLLDLPPLHIFIQREARSVVHRLMQGQSPIRQQHGSEHQKLYLEVKADPILGMPTDTMVPKYSFQKNFVIKILDREEWSEGPPITAQNVWYTDGSKTEQGGGAGIYGARPKTKIPISLGRYTTVFQAEVTAIQVCAKEMIRQGTARQSIAIYSDSQAALKAIGSMQVCSRLVWDCINALQELGSQNKLTLAWVPGHKGHRGNEEADRLAREGAGKALIGPEPFCGIAKTYVRASINEWMDGKSREWWESLPRQRQAKMFIKERSARLTEDLLGQNRRAIRIMVGLLTGHCRLNKHMSLMGLAEDALCRFCSEEEESSVHILCQCEGLARLRFLTLGEENPRASSYTEVPLSRLWSLIQRTQLDKVL